MKKAFVTIVLVAVVAIATGLIAMRTTKVAETIREANQWSAVVSLEQEIISYAEKYYRENLKYPESIDPALLDFTSTDGATSEMVDRFVYISSGSTYSLHHKNEK